MMVAKFKVRGAPSKQPCTPTAIRAGELTPSGKALLIAVKGACGKVGGTRVLLGLFADGSAAAQVCLFAIARAALQVVFWVFWVERREGREGRFHGGWSDANAGQVWLGAIFGFGSNSSSVVRWRSCSSHGRGRNQRLNAAPNETSWTGRFFFFLFGQDASECQS